MTRSEAAAAIGQRVRVESGKYGGQRGRIWGITRKLVEVRIEGSGWLARLAPYRLRLIDEPKEETRG